MTSDEKTTASVSRASGARKQRASRAGRDGTETGLRIAIVAVAIGMTLAAGFMVYRAVVQGNEAPRNYWEYQMRVWKNTIRGNPQSPVGYENLGYVYYRMGRNRQAVNTLKQSIALDPKRVMALINLGRTYKQMGQEDLAIKYMLRGTALALGTNKAAPYFEVGEIYRARNDIPNAIKYYKLSVAADRTIWNTHIELGEIYEEQKKFDIALAEFGQALKFHPTDSKNSSKVAALSTKVFAMGQAAKEQGSDQKAIKYYRYIQDFGVEGQRGEALLELGLLLSSQKKYSNAEAALKQCIADGANKPDPGILKKAHLELAKVYAAKGQHSKAGSERTLASKY